MTGVEEAFRGTNQCEALVAAAAQLVARLYARIAACCKMIDRADPRERTRSARSTLVKLFDSKHGCTHSRQSITPTCSSCHIAAACVPASLWLLGSSPRKLQTVTARASPCCRARVLTTAIS